MLRQLHYCTLVEPAAICSPCVSPPPHNFCGQTRSSHASSTNAGTQTGLPSRSFFGWPLWIGVKFRVIASERNCCKDLCLSNNKLQQKTIIGFKRILNFSLTDAKTQCHRRYLDLILNDVLRKMLCTLRSSHA